MSFVFLFYGGSRSYDSPQVQSMVKHIAKLEAALHEEARGIYGYKSVIVARQLTSLKEEFASLCFPTKNGVM